MEPVHSLLRETFDDLKIMYAAIRALKREVRNIDKNPKFVELEGRCNDAIERLNKAIQEL